MARLESSERTDLPDRAFAYVDSRGRRRLPIHDAAHVRNALARFNQVHFEDDAARERARNRLLNAAKKHGIVPLGFIASQLDSERAFGERRAREPAALPTGFLTMLMTDIEDSSGLVDRLGEAYRKLIGDVRTLLRETALAFAGQAVETRADEFFAVFESPGAALDAAIAIQRELRAAVVGGRRRSRGPHRHPQRLSDARRGQLHRARHPHDGPGLRRRPRRPGHRVRRHEGGEPGSAPRRPSVREPR